MLLTGTWVHAATVYPGAEWHHIPAQEAGWSPSGLAAAHDRAIALHSTALMVVAHGVVVADWGDTVKPTELASVRKSLLSALIGIAVAQHKIDLDSMLARLGIDEQCTVADRYREAGDRADAVAGPLGDLSSGAV